MIKRLLILLPLLFVQACLPYWSQTRAPAREPATVVYVDDTRTACGSFLLGCYIIQQNLIVVKKNLPLEEEKCVLAHEQKHHDGFSHDDRPGYSIDCGDGTIWIPPLRLN